MKKIIETSENKDDVNDAELFEKLMKEAYDMVNSGNYGEARDFFKELKTSNIDIKRRKNVIVQCLKLLEIETISMYNSMLEFIRDTIAYIEKGE